MTNYGTTNLPVEIVEAEILRVETGHVLLSWPVGADPDRATRRWMPKMSEFGPEAVGGRMYVRL